MEKDIQALIDEASRMFVKIGDRMMPVLEHIERLEMDLLLHGIAITAPSGERIDPADFFVAPPTQADTD